MVVQYFRVTNLVTSLENQCLELTARQYFIHCTTLGQMDDSLKEEKKA